MTESITFSPGTTVTSNWLNAVDAHVFDYALNVKDYGAVGDGVTNDVSALQNAFNALVLNGGGELIIPPGTYYLGSFSTSSNIITITNLEKAKISAHGAVFVVNTTAAVTPFAFYFVDPQDVVWDGGEFYDSGFNPSVWAIHSRWGMGAIRLDATEQHSGFTVQNVYAHELTYLLVADLRSNKRTIRDIVVRDCRVTNSYYGVDVIYVGDNLKVDNLRCINVRRTVIGYGLRNCDLDVKLYCDSGFIGSNAAISIAEEGTYGGINSEVRNIRVKMNVSGYECHTSYVHLYFQQADSVGGMSGVDIDVKVNDLDSTGKSGLIGDTNIVKISHENASGVVLGTTSRTIFNCFIDISLVGSITGVPFSIVSENSTTPFEVALSERTRNICHTYITSQITGLNYLSPWEKTLSLIPIGTTSSGTASGLVSKGSISKIGNRVFFNASLTWTSHTGTGNLRLSSLPFPLDTSVMTTPAITVVPDGLSHVNSLCALIGGVNDSQIILYSETGGTLTELPIDSAASLYISGSYITTE